MDGYLLDTNITSRAFYEGSKQHKPIRSRLASLGDDPVFISAVSLAETEYGLKVFPLDKQMQRDIRSAMATYKVLPIDHHTAEIYGKIRASLFSAYAPRDRRNRIASHYADDLREVTTGKELGIQENDLWIVSVAVEYNLMFVTTDKAGGMRKIVDAANYAHRTQFWP